MKRNRVRMLALFLAAGAALAWVLWGMYRHEERQLLELHRAELAAGYASTIEGFGRLVGAIHRLRVDTPVVRDLLAQAAALDDSVPEQAPERRRLRGRLYRELYGVHQELLRNGVLTFQFVAPDGRSFLRFHRPDLVDDQLAARRLLVDSALRAQAVRQGFESGRDYAGHRYLLPVLSDGRLVAVADYGLSLAATDGAPGAADTARAGSGRLLLRRALLESVAHPSALTRYRRAALHPEFVIAKSDAPVSADPTQPLPAVSAEVDARLAGSGSVRRAVAEGRAHARHLCPHLDHCVAVVLLPVMDSAGRVGAYFVAHRDAPELPLLRLQFLSLLGVGGLLLLLAGIALWRWLASRRRLRTITEHMGEGLYVMDAQGRIIHVNAAACAILGYGRDELLGAKAHALFHAHTHGERLTEHNCPLRQEPLRGAVYRSDNETFRRRDGAAVQVNVVASPLREDGVVAGSIVLFRDVTAELAARERLRRVDVAFHNLAEAVALTGPDARIQAVNRAFTEITGYSEAEVLGQTPRILSSGRHDQRFYAALWHELGRTGRWEGEIWNRRKSGEVYPEWLKINAVTGTDGDVVGYVSVFSDITEVRASEDRLRRLAYHDQLTGLYNRNAFVESLRHALLRAAAAGERVALLYLDLDRFKRINDTLGHVTGDLLLREIAERIRAALRPQDQGARLGGDEFVLLLDGALQNATAPRVAHALLAAVRRPLVIEGRRLHVTASIGIAMFPEDGGDAATLLKHADAAMYLAKQQGRDGYRYFTATMAEEGRRRFELESALREALRHDRLRLVYQPKVSLADGSIVGLEALLRWQHPRQGLLAPGSFLDVAREAGLMQSITEWLLHQAACQCRAWRTEQVPFGRVSVNLDAGWFQPLPLEGLLLQIVREAGITPDDLELEILETAMRNDAETSALWPRLVDAGFELSIDDFGTGESSLARIKQLPIRTLKIDRSFLADIEHNDSDRSMIRTIVAMTKTLGKRALAEGVETEAQLRFLLRTGCELAQGFYFSRPLPPEQIAPLLREAPYVPVMAALREGLPAAQGAVVHQLRSSS